MTTLFEIWVTRLPPVGYANEPGTSAIFILVRKSTPDKVLEDLSKFEGKVLRTSLSHEDEAKLQAALTKSAAG